MFWQDSGRKAILGVGGAPSEADYGILDGGYTVDVGCYSLVAAADESAPTSKTNAIDDEIFQKLKQSSNIRKDDFDHKIAQWHQDKDVIQCI